MTLYLNGTTGVSGVDGSAGTPSLQGNDTNTGIVFGTDTVGVSTGGVQRTTVDSSGRLLVGTSTARSNINWYSSPQTPPVQFEASGNAYGGLSLTTYSVNNYSPLLTLGTSASDTPGANALVGSSNQLGAIQFNGNDGSSFRTAAVITAATDATTSSGVIPARLSFYTTAAGASTPTERMRLDRNGELDNYSSGAYIYKARSSSAAGTSAHLYYGGHSSSGINGSTASYLVYTNGNVQNTNGSYTTLSDVKLKENIVDAGSQWGDIKSITIRNWNFKEETGHETHRQIGPIAQELETVCPGLVFETPDRDEDGNETGEVTKGVNQSVLYMKAVKALQEAMERIEQLETRISNLEVTP